MLEEQKKSVVFLGIRVAILYKGDNCFVLTSRWSVYILRQYMLKDRIEDNLDNFQQSLGLLYFYHIFTFKWLFSYQV